MASTKMKYSNKVDSINVANSGKLSGKSEILYLLMDIFFSQWDFFSRIFLQLKKLFFGGVWRDPGVSLKGRISLLPKQPCWLYT